MFVQTLLGSRADAFSPINRSVSRRFGQHGPVALTAYVMKARQPGSELVEVIQTRYVLFAYVITLRASHTRGDYARRQAPRNTTYVGWMALRTSRAEQDWASPPMAAPPIIPANAISFRPC
jgi:hypothetical protein